MYCNVFVRACMLPVLLLVSSRCSVTHNLLEASRGVGGQLDSTVHGINVLENYC